MSAAVGLVSPLRFVLAWWNVTEGLVIRPSVCSPCTLSLVTAVSTGS